MSEPLTREELNRLAEWTDTDPSVVRRNLTRRALSDLAALEKSTEWQRDLIAELTTERNTLRAQLLRTIEQANADYAALRARCEQQQSELAAGHRAFEALFGETMNGRDFAVKQSMAQQILSDREARCEQLEQLYSHKDLDFECAVRGCKSNIMQPTIDNLNARCERLEEALQLYVDHFGDPLKVARKALGNSTIASESTG